jgi:hypothetical protein
LQRKCTLIVYRPLIPVNDFHVPTSGYFMYDCYVNKRITLQFVVMRISIGLLFRIRHTNSTLSSIFSWIINVEADNTFPPRKCKYWNFLLFLIFFPSNFIATREFLKSRRYSVNLKLKDHINRWHRRTVRQFAKFCTRRNVMYNKISHAL